MIRLDVDMRVHRRFQIPSIEVYRRIIVVLAKKIPKPRELNNSKIDIKTK